MRLISLGALSLVLEAAMPRILLILSVVLCASAVLPSTAQASLYLRLVGAQQGAIEGDVTGGGPSVDGTIEITSFQLGVSQFIDPVTGQPQGPISVSSLTLSKNTDGSTVSLLKALGSIEPMTTCTLEAWRPGQPGTEELYLRLTLTNARVETHSIAAGGAARASESLSFVFDTLEWRDLITGRVYNYASGPSSAEPSALGDRFAVATTPNPTSGETRFEFRMPASGPVSIDVFDFRGRHVAKVFDGEASATEGSVFWDGLDTVGRRVASGVYLVKMRTGAWLTTHKMSVLR